MTRGSCSCRSSTVEWPSTWTTAAGTDLRLLQTISEISFIWRPKRLVWYGMVNVDLYSAVVTKVSNALTLLDFRALYKSTYLSIYLDCWPKSWWPVDPVKTLLHIGWPVCNVVIGQRSSKSRLSCCHWQPLKPNCQAVHVSDQDRSHAACLVLTAPYCKCRMIDISQRSIWGCGLLTPIYCMNDYQFLYHVYLIHRHSRGIPGSRNPRPR